MYLVVGWSHALLPFSGKSQKLKETERLRERERKYFLSVGSEAALKPSAPV